MHSRSHVTVVMTLTVVMLTIALALAGGPARATADTITIGTPVTVIPLGGAGGVQLAVTADSTTPLLSMTVHLLPRHSSTWYWIARVTTNAKGNFSSTFTDPVTAVWSAEYLGDKTRPASVGAMIPVTVS